jgi:hypothetical protein
LIIHRFIFLVDNPSFYFPFSVVCKEYTPEDDDFVEIDTAIDYETIRDCDEYQTFQLWENLQKLDLQTIQLMTKGFLEKITLDSIENKLMEKALVYRKKWDRQKCDSENIEEFGENEYFGGKAEAFEESLEIIRVHMQSI